MADVYSLRCSQQVVHEVTDALMSQERPPTLREYVVESTLTEERQHARLQPGIENLTTIVLDNTERGAVMSYSGNHQPLYHLWERYPQQRELK